MSEKFSDCKRKVPGRFVKTKFHLFIGTFWVLKKREHIYFERPTCGEKSLDTEQLIFVSQYITTKTNIILRRKITMEEAQRQSAWFQPSDFVKDAF